MSVESATHWGYRTHNLVCGWEPPTAGRHSSRPLVNVRSPHETFTNQQSDHHRAGGQRRADHQRPRQRRTPTASINNGRPGITTESVIGLINIGVQDVPILTPRNNSNAPTTRPSTTVTIRCRTFSTRYRYSPETDQRTAQCFPRRVRRGVCVQTRCPVRTNPVIAHPHGW